MGTRTRALLGAGVVLLLAGCGTAAASTSTSGPSLSDTIATSGKIAPGDSPDMRAAKLVHNSVPFTDNGETGLSDAHVARITTHICSNMHDMTADEAIAWGKRYLMEQLPGPDWTRDAVVQVETSAMVTKCPDLAILDLGSANQVESSSD